MARENKAICPMCGATFPVKMTVGIGSAKVFCPNRKCRVNLEVEMGIPGPYKAKWIGPPIDIKRTTV